MGRQSAIIERIAAGLLVTGLLAVLVVGLSGCATTLGGPMKVHGNFCGPNHPKLSATTRDAAFLELANIPATDDIDLVCKSHDMCYANYASGHPSCDSAFQFALRPYLFDHPACTRLATQLAWAVVYGSSNLELKPEKIDTPVVDVPRAAGNQVVAAGGRALLAPWVGTELAMNELQYQQKGAPTLPAGHVCKLVGLKPEWRGQAIPARFKAPGILP